MEERSTANSNRGIDFGTRNAQAFSQADMPTGLASRDDFGYFQGGKGDK